MSDKQNANNLLEFDGSEARQHYWTTTQVQVPEGEHAGAWVYENGAAFQHAQLAPALSVAILARDAAIALIDSQLKTLEAQQLLIDNFEQTLKFVESERDSYGSDMEYLAVHAGKLEKENAELRSRCVMLTEAAKRRVSDDCLLRDALKEIELNIKNCSYCGECAACGSQVLPIVRKALDKK